MSFVPVSGTRNTFWSYGNEAEMLPLEEWVNKRHQKYYNQIGPLILSSSPSKNPIPIEN